MGLHGDLWNEERRRSAIYLVSRFFLEGLLLSSKIYNLGAIFLLLWFSKCIRRMAKLGV